MSDNQRADLDGCTVDVDCTGDYHLLCCSSTGRRLDAEPQADPQVWIRSSTSSNDVAVTEEVSIEVNARGKVQLDEAFMAQLLVDAGWERTA